MSHNKKKFYLENLICFFIIINPILDIISFLIRNNVANNPFGNNSVTIVLRPIIPLFLSLYIFIKGSSEKKRRLLLIVFIYALYAVEHMITCLESFKGWSFGTPRTELSFILNYTFFIVTLVVIKNIVGVDTKLKIAKSKSEVLSNKVKNSIIIALAIYIISIFISIFTKTSSYTYPEVNIGYKGWIESGNCLSIFLILAFIILLSQIKTPKGKREISIQIAYVVLAITTIIYLVFIMGTRVGLYGTFLSLGIWTLLKLIIDKDFRIGIIGSIIIIILAFSVHKFGSNTLNRRSQLDEANQNIIEAHSIEVYPEQIHYPNQEENPEEVKRLDEGRNHVTKDIGEVHDKIKNHDVPDKYMTLPQKESIEKLYEQAHQKQIDSNDNRSQQLIYHINLVKQERDIYKIFFGNGFQTPSGELILEKEFFALLFNFGICGFILYFSPILLVLIWSIARFFKFIHKMRKENLFKVLRRVSIETYMDVFAIALVVILSIVIGYILFNVSNSTLIATIMILLYNKVKEEI